MKNMSLNDIYDQIWNDLQDGVRNTKSAFHYPIISTIDKNGYPTSRTVVLRQIHKENNTISFNTDVRSEKWLEIKNNNNISLTIYESNKKIQIRILGLAILNYKNKTWETAWNSTPNMSRECYSTPYPPSTNILNPEDIDNSLKKIKDADLEEYKINFGRIDIKVKSIDWLYLIHSGHRRVKFDYGKKITMNWLAP